MDERLQSLCRATWAAMERGGTHSLDTLAMITGGQPSDVAVVVGSYMNHGYIWMTGTSKAASGEAIPQFKLVKRTGPEAPVWDEAGRLVDPNVKVGKPTPRVKVRGRRESPDFPTLPALIRMHAERLGGEVTKRAIEEACNCSGQDFNRAWDQLRWRAETVPTEREDAAGKRIYLLRPNATVNRVRAFFCSNLGRDVRGRELADAGGKIPHGSLTRRALDMLAAEGFTVSIKSDGHPGLTIYRVEKGGA